MLTSVALVAVTLAAVPRVASPAWTTVNLKPELATVYADRLAQSVRSEGLQIVTSQDIVTLIGNERQRQLVDCSEAAASCMAELANALGCEATLLVSVARLDDGSFHGVAKLVSSQDGRVLSSIPIDGTSERALLHALDDAGERLAAPLVVKAPRASVRAGVWAVGLSGAAGVIAGGVLVGLARQKYYSLGQSNDLAAASAGAREGAALQTGGFALAGVGAAAVLGAVLWHVLIPGEPALEPRVEASESHTTFGVAGNF
jgi:hypothetical protein